MWGWMSYLKRQVGGTRKGEQLEIKILIEIICLREIAREDQVFFGPDRKEYTWRMSGKDCEVRLTCIQMISPPQMLLTALELK